MSGLQTFGDILAGTFGHPVDREGAQLEGYNIGSQIKLRSASTESALEQARERRAAAVLDEQYAARRRQAEEHPELVGGAFVENLMGTGFGNAQQAFEAQLKNQEFGNRATLSNPTADPAQQFAAGQGVKGQVLNRYDVQGNMVNDLTKPNVAPTPTAIGQAQIANYQETSKAGAAAAAGSVPVTPVTIQDPANPNATIVVDGRTGKLIGAGPKLTQVGTGQLSRAVTQDGITDIIQRAEDVLGGVTRSTDAAGNTVVTQGGQLPTQSGAGALLDAGAQFFGRAPAGAAESDKLRALGASLTSRVPRMQGPQSNADLRQYQEMAGQVGDATLPIPRRLAALQEVKRLWAKYDPQGDYSAFQATSAIPAAGSDAEAVPEFASVSEAEAAGLAPGTRITIGGRAATVQ